MAKLGKLTKKPKKAKVVKVNPGKKAFKRPSNLKSKIGAVNKKKDEKLYGGMSFDDFLSKGLDIDSDDNTENQNEANSKSRKDSKVTNENIFAEEHVNESEEDDFKAEEDDSEDDVVNESELEDGDDLGNENELEDDDDEDDNDKAHNSDQESDDDTEMQGDEIKSHKKSLDKLKETDPEFYKFLQDNDKKLLRFGESDSEEASEDEDDKDRIHKPNEQLEIASDESDFEADDDDKKLVDSQNITLKMLKTWQNDIRVDKTNKTLHCLVQAFHAALRRVSSEQDQEPSQYKVDGSAVFNGVIQLCVLELGPAVRKFLGLSPGSKQPPHKCKKFAKVKTLLRSYFTDLLKLLGGVTSANILTVLLKHLHYMCPLMVSFSKTTKPLLKRLVYLWGTADEAVRVVAFLCILRITGNQTQALLDSVLKMMYMTYVKNSKFVSASTLPGINFMRRSMVEMFALDLNVAYQHVFMYIRQLAIHLRNAITIKKKENMQIVYNWQFVNSLRLWGNLFGVTCNKPQLNPLIYPFVQVCIGAISLVPTAQYYPLRFHILQILIDLTRDTQITVPVLPYLLDVLHGYDFNKKHLKVSMKPLQFTSLLRLSKSQLSENGFKDAVVDMIYGQLLEYLSIQSNSIAFPDLTLSCIFQLKLFIKKCSNHNYTKKMKQIMEKIQQNSQFVENERKSITLILTDFKQIEGFEAQLKNKGPPLLAFYESWDKLRKIKKNKQATNNEALADYKLPILKKAKKSSGKTNSEENKPVELFPSDSDSDDENVSKPEEETKKTRGKRGGKNAQIAKKKFVDHSGPVEDSGEKDVVVDLKMSDW